VVDSELARLAADLPAASGGEALLPVLRALDQRLRDQGEQWYAGEVAVLPNSSAGLGERIAALAGLRDRAPARQRPDAEARYQEALARCSQIQLDIRRRMRRAIEEGRFAELPGLAASGDVLVGTPLEAMQRQLVVQAREAAGARPLWKGSWILTQPALRKAVGEQMPPAVACLALMGETAAARQVADAAGNALSGDLLLRREALFNRRAVVLTFADPGDLQYLDFLQGVPRLGADGLQGGAGEAFGLACNVPVGGQRYDAQVRLRLGAGDGQAVLSVVRDGASVLLVRIEGARLVVRCEAGAQAAEARPPRPPGPQLTLRLVQRDGLLRVMINEQQALEVAGVPVPAGARLRLDAAGLDWSLQGIQVLGGSD
jgi:hypothetical protein